MDLNTTQMPLSLNGLDEQTSDIFYVPSLFADDITPYQNDKITIKGNIKFDENIEVGNLQLNQYVRNQINVSGALVYDSLTGLIDGLHINNLSKTVILTLDSTNVLSGQINGGISQSLILYCNYSQSNPDGSKVLSIFPSGSEVITSTTISGFSTLQLSEFEIYQSTLNNSVFIPAGFYNLNVFASANDDNDKIAIFSRIYHKEYLTSSETMIGESEQLNINTTLPLQFDLTMLNENQRQFNVNDSFILKIFAKSLVNPAHIIHIYYQGATHYTHMHTQFNALNSFQFNYPLSNDGQNNISISQVSSTTDGYLSSIQYNSLLAIQGSKWESSGTDIYNSNTGNVIISNTAKLLVNTNNTPVGVMNSDAKMIINAPDTVSNGLQIISNNAYDTIRLTEASNIQNFAPSICLERARGSINSPSYVSANDIIGQLVFRGLNGSGTPLYSRPADIQCIALQDFNNGANMGGAITFRTCSLNSFTLVERLSISNTINISGDVINSNNLIVNGNIGIGITNPTYKLQADGNILLSGTGRSLWIGGETGLNQNGTRIHYLNNNTYYDNRGTNGFFSWRNDATTGATERMRLTQTDLLMNTNITSSGTGRIVGAVNFENTLAVRGNQTNSGTLTTTGNISTSGGMNIGTGNTYKINNVQLKTSDIPEGGGYLYSQWSNNAGYIDYGSGDVRLTTTGQRWLNFNHTGTSPIGAGVMGITFKDFTSTLYDNSISFGSNQIYFKTGGSQKMSIGENVDFSAMPLLNSNPITADNIPEGISNKYYTDTKARNAISALFPLSYIASTGVMSLSTANQATEWKRSTQTSSTGNQYFFVARMFNASTGDAGMTFRGYIGGYENNRVAKIDIGISVRNGIRIVGQVITPNSTLANVLSFADIVIYQQTIAGLVALDIYLVSKASQFHSWDITINGTNGASLNTPTTTPTTPAGTEVISSVLSSVNQYEISGNVGIGKTNPDSRFDVNGRLQISNVSNIDGGDAVINFKTNNSTLGYIYLDQATSNFFITRRTEVSGTLKATNLEVSNASITTNTNDLFINAGTTNQIIHIRPNGNGSVTGQSKFYPTYTSLQGDALYINSVANVGIGTTTAETTFHINSIKTDGTSAIIQSNYNNDGTASSRRILVGQNNFRNSIQAQLASITWQPSDLLLNPFGGNIGIGTNAPTAKLTVLDTAIVSNAETTTTYDNSLELFRASGTSYSINEIISGGYNFKTVGSVPVVYFSNVGTDGSIYIDCNTGANKVILGVNQLTTAYGALFSNPSWIIDMNIYIKQLDTNADNVIFDCPSGQIGINTSGQLYFLTKWSTFTTRLTWTTFGSKASADLDTWYRITIYFVNASRLTTAIINGTNNGTLSGYDNSTIISDNVSIGGVASKLLFYMNTFRMVYSGDFTVNTLPLAPRASGNVFLMRILRSDNVISLNRAGYLSGISNYDSYQLLRIDSISGTNDGYRINSASFTKRSLNERLVLHYRYSAYASTAGIHTTWFYIHEGGTNTYTNQADYAKNQWSTGSYGQRVYTTGTLFIPDGLPIGNYYIVFNNPAQLRCDFNDEIRLYLTTTQV